MYLKRLEVHGFKTFADKTVIDFTNKDGLTAIVGPNGCGKSNLVDAIRWVMGEQSIKLLRGSSQEEVIFQGSNERKPLSLAEVTLTIDNSSGKKLPIDYEEVQVTRKYYRSGESEYYINKQRSLLREVQTLLMDTGIGKGSYSIIGQGQVTEILHSKPEDRRSLFEEAAGINKYKTRKVVAERKLAATAQNLTRLQDIRSEIHQQLGPLEEQARKAEEYKLSKEELGGMEVGLYKEKVVRLDNIKKDLTDKITQYTEVVQRSDESVEDIERKKQEFREKINELDGQIVSKQQEVNQTKVNVENTGGEIKVARERAEHLSHREIELKSEIEQLLSNKQELSAKLSTAEAEEKAGADAVVEMDKKVNSKDQEIERINSEWRRVNGELEDLKKELAEIDNRLENTKSKLLGLSSTEKYTSDDVKREEENKQRLYQEQKDIENKSKELNKRKEYIDSEMAKLKNIREELFRSRTELEANKKENINVKQDKKEAYDQKISRLDLLKEMQASYEGFYKGVRSILTAKKNDQEQFCGVHSVIADLITMDQKYETAIEVALGSALQDIVVDDEEIAKSSIAYLKENSMGRATFLPVNLVKGESISIADVTIASEIVNCDQQYDQIIKFLLGRIILADDIDGALDLRKKYNGENIKCIVTINGEVITMGGSISGGSLQNKGTQLLSRQREIIELQRDTEVLRNDLEQIDQEAANIQNELIEAENNVKDKGKQLSALEVEQGTLINDLARAQIDKAKLEKDLFTAAGSKDQSEKELDRISVEKQHINQELENINNERAAKLGEIQQKEEAQEKIAGEKEQVNEILTEIKIAVANAKAHHRQQELKISSLRESLAGNEQLQQQKQEESLSCSEKLKGTNSLISESQEKMPELQELVGNAEQGILDLQNERNRYFNDLTVYDRKEKELNEEDRKVRGILAEEEIKLARIVSEYEEIERRLISEYDYSIEDVLNAEVIVENYEEVNEKVEKLKRKIKRMEPVNLLAIDEYRAQKDRLVFIEKQCEDLDKSKEDLNTLIAELDIIAIKEFREAFDIVNGHFKRIFTQLFDGGSAELHIMDEENVLESGIEIYAQVPGNRKRQSLTLLSGGQKALTAITLLFSLLSARPSPFCILDEIDAALDDSNIGRVTDILKEYAQDTQVIIITHRQPTMSIVDTLFGITMETTGVSKLVSVKLADAEKFAEEQTIEPVAVG